MAFSYSDENFTVIGNLCFVHIILDGTTKIYNIPPAISDRMLSDGIGCVYPYSPVNNTGGFTPATSDISFAVIVNGKIFCRDKGKGYLSFFFPIDSNK